MVAELVVEPVLLRGSWREPFVVPTLRQGLVGLPLVGLSPLVLVPGGVLPLVLSFRLMQVLLEGVLVRSSDLAFPRFVVGFFLRRSAGGCSFL